MISITLRSPGFTHEYRVRHEEEFDELIKILHEHLKGLFSMPIADELRLIEKVNSALYANQFSASIVVSLEGKMYPAEVERDIKEKVETKVRELFEGSRVLPKELVNFEITFID